MRRHLPRIGFQAVRFALICTAALTAVTATAAILAAQTIECLKPVRTEKGCRLELPGKDADELLLVRLLNNKGDGVKSITVNFAADAGAIEDQQLSDTRGVVPFQFRRSGLNTRVIIHMRAAFDGKVVRDSIIVEPMPEFPASKWQIAERHGDYPAWYVERQVPFRTGFRIDGPDANACSNVRVRFRATTESSGAGPDTVAAAWRDYNNRIGCYAETRWKLGKEIGEQSLQATIVGEPKKAVQFTATARALPRFMAGISFSGVTRYSRLVDSTRIIKVTRTIDGGQQSYDSVATSQRAERSDGTQITPIIGIDFSPHLGFKNLRVIIGASATDARNEWVIGFSGLQALFGVQREAVPVDLQVIAHFQRRKSVMDPGACNSGVSGGCSTRSESAWVPNGFGAMLSVDGFSLLTQFLSAFPFK